VRRDAQRAGAGVVPTLHLGVLDVAYSDASGSGAKTTGEIAEGLENGFPSKDGKRRSKGYHIMQTFYDENSGKIANWIAEDIAQSIVMLVKRGSADSVRGASTSSAMHEVAEVKYTMTGSQSGTFTYGADQKIETAFRAFIFGGEMAKLKGSSVTAIAPTGYSRRFKNPSEERPARPDFVDTGLYVASMRAWTTNG